MNALALITVCYILPVLLAHVFHAARKAPQAVSNPPDADDPNFDSMWEAASR